jgi:hypothetical protein
MPNEIAVEECDREAADAFEIAKVQNGSEEISFRQFVNEQHELLVQAFARARIAERERIAESVRRNADFEATLGLQVIADRLFAMADSISPPPQAKENAR